MARGQQKRSRKTGQGQQGGSQSPMKRGRGGMMGNGGMGRY